MLFPSAGGDSSGCLGRREECRVNVGPRRRIRQHPVGITEKELVVVSVRIIVAMHLLRTRGTKT
jgi:hypothetical protein